MEYPRMWLVSLALGVGFLMANPSFLEGQTPGAPQKQQQQKAQPQRAKQPQQSSGPQLTTPSPRPQPNIRHTQQPPDGTTATGIRKTPTPGSAGTTTSVGKTTPPRPQPNIRHTHQPPDGTAATGSRKTPTPGAGAGGGKTGSPPTGQTQTTTGTGKTGFPKLGGGDEYKKYMDQFKGGGSSTGYLKEGGKTPTGPTPGSTGATPAGGKTTAGPTTPGTGAGTKLPEPGPRINALQSKITEAEKDIAGYKAQRDRYVQQYGTKANTEHFDRMIEGKQAVINNYNREIGWINKGIQ